MLTMIYYKLNYAYIKFDRSILLKKKNNAAQYRDVNTESLTEHLKI